MNQSKEKVIIYSHIFMLYGVIQVCNSRWCLIYLQSSSLSLRMSLKSTHGTLMMGISWEKRLKKNSIAQPAEHSHNKPSPWTLKCLSVCNFLTFFAELHGSTEAVKLPVAVIRGRVCVWGKQQNKTTTNNDAKQKHAAGVHKQTLAGVRVGGGHAGPTGLAVGACC